MVWETEEQTLKRFEQAFPQIEDVTMEVREVGHMARHTEPSLIGKTSLVSGLLDCSNPSCRKGGFALRHILYEMVRDGKSELETGKKCQGQETGRACLNVVTVKVSIKYKKHHPS